MPQSMQVNLVGKVGFVTTGGYAVIDLKQPFCGCGTVVVSDQTRGWCKESLSRLGLQIIILSVNKYKTGLEALQLAAIN